MRTVRRQIAELNVGKREAVSLLVLAFAAEKSHWLDVFARKDTRALIKRHRTVRDKAVASRHSPAPGLQARMWKLALIDAAETWNKYWQAMFVGVRAAISRRKDFGEAELHYAFWLLKGYKQFFACMDGETPVPRFDIDDAAARRVAAYVRRGVQRLRGRQPSLKKAKSVALDENCYTVFEHNGTQYIKIMSCTPGRRITLPLKGHARISGNIRIVMSRGGIEAHVPQKVKGRKPEAKKEVSVDFGYTEAMTDAEGNAYGKELGRIIADASDDRHMKGRKRNKLRALSKKYAASDSPRQKAKAAHITRYNLGQQKWDRREQTARAAISCEINRALNTLVRERRPSVLVTEDLRHAFAFDKSKNWNRKLSSWVRGVLQDRTEFKALAEGFRHEQVNPAYGSQTCPSCGFVDGKNRNGDRFRCLHCGHKGHADQVAAMNILSRYGDQQITRYTSYREVKTILLERFHRRLEEGVPLAPLTVPGRTLDTVPTIPLKSPRRKPQREGLRAVHPAVNQRAKQPSFMVKREYV